MALAPNLAARLTKLIVTEAMTETLDQLSKLGDYTHEQEHEVTSQINLDICTALSILSGVFGVKFVGVDHLLERLDAVARPAGEALAAKLSDADELTEIMEGLREAATAMAAEREAQAGAA